MIVDDLFESRSLTETFDVGPQEVNGVIFDVRLHALERLEQRHVPVTTAKEMLRRVAKSAQSLRRSQPEGEPFWVYDDGLDISLGLRFLGNRILWATSLVGHPRNSQGRYPIVNIDN